MARRIDDDILAPFRHKEGTRRIDSDALFLFFQKGIKEKRIFKLFPLLAADRLDLL